MATPGRTAGFTLLEIIVAIAILAIVAGTVLPLGSSQRRTDQTDRVRAKLAAIESGLIHYRRDRGAFPPRLDDPTFLGPYCAAGIGNDGIRDDWSPTGDTLQYQVTAGVANVWSVGPVPIAGTPEQQSYAVDVQPSEVDAVIVTDQNVALTRTLLRDIVTRCWTSNARYQQYRYTSAYLGPFSYSRGRLRLPSSVRSTDYWGTRLRGHYYGFTMSSAGPDRIWSTADDLTEVMP